MDRTQKAGHRELCFPQRSAFRSELDSPLIDARSSHSIVAAATSILVALARRSFPRKGCFFDTNAGKSGLSLFTAVPERDMIPPDRASRRRSQAFSALQIRLDLILRCAGRSSGAADARRGQNYGIAPGLSGHPAYQYLRDPDGDEVVCE